LLNAYSVVFRYPGAEATREHAREALKTIPRLRETFRGTLGLPNAV
jgi:hypothetical protein